MKSKRQKYLYLIIFFCSVLTLIFLLHTPKQSEKKERDHYHSDIELNKFDESGNTSFEGVDENSGPPGILSRQGQERLSGSARVGDPRTPPILEQTDENRFFRPAPDVLADPAAYEAAQKAARGGLSAETFRAAQKQIIEMKKKIQVAEQKGRRSPAELHEARQALGELSRLARSLNPQKEKE